MSDLLKTVERAGEGGLLLVEQFFGSGPAREARWRRERIPEKERADGRLRRSS